MTPTGKDYDISLEDIMSGDTTSSSSGAGDETGSETGGQGISEEVLRNLESLTQRMKSLEEEVQTSKSSLSELREAYNGLTNEGGIGSSTLSEVTRVNGKTIYDITVPEGAKGIICSCSSSGTVMVYMENADFVVFERNKDSAGEAYTTWQQLLIPSGVENLRMTSSNSAIVINYAFF